MSPAPKKKIKTRAEFLPRGVTQTNVKLYTLPRLELGERAVVGIEIASAGYAGDRAGAAHLPVCPCIGIATAAPHIACATRVPRISSVKVLAIIISDVGPKRDRTAQMASVACADINNSSNAVGRLGVEIYAEVIEPRGVSSLAARDAVERFEIDHRHDRFTVVDHLRTGYGPEEIHLRTRASGIRVGEVIGGHLDAGGFASAHVAGKIGIGETGIFGRFGERIAHAIAIDAGPID